MECWGGEDSCCPGDTCCEDQGQQGEHSRETPARFGSWLTASWSTTVLGSGFGYSEIAQVKPVMQMTLPPKDRVLLVCDPESSTSNTILHGRMESRLGNAHCQV